MLSSEGGDWGRIVPGVSASLISEGVRGLLALLATRDCPRVGLHGDSRPCHAQPSQTVHTAWEW